MGAPELEFSAKNIAALINDKTFLFENKTKKDSEFDYLLTDQDSAPEVQSYLEVI